MKFPTLKKNFSLQTKAQTVVELAVFGAILTFILGIMIRQSLSFNYAQSQNFKAMRLAMAESFKTAEAGHASRNSATLVFIEDRISAEIGKYGALTRTPAFAAASATFSKNLSLPVDYPPPTAMCQGKNPPPECESEKDLPLLDMFINGKHFTFAQSGFREYDLWSSSSPHPQTYSDARWQQDWNQPNCPNNRTLYTVVPNFSGEGLENNWDPNCAECFDLDRDGIVDVPPADRATFTWQWQKVCPRAGAGGINLQKNSHVRLDVDGDMKEETILQMVDENGVVYTPQEAPRKGNHRIRIVRVLDDQAADIDNTWSKNSALNDGKLRPGLRDDLQIYTYTQQGTYLLLEEGKDVTSPPSGNQTVVSTQKRNNADIIQRMIQLSNDTGRFCKNGSPNAQENTDVEVCGTNADCFTPQNVYRTCFATDTLILYVRSRIADLRGRKWITDLGPRGF